MFMRSISHLPLNRKLSQKNPLITIFLSQNNIILQNNLPVLAQYRSIHSTERKDSALIAAGVGIFVSAAVVQYALSQSNQNKTDSETTENPIVNATEEQIKTEEPIKARRSRASSANNDQSKANAEGEPKISENWFSTFFAKNFYDGGFEGTMTKREAVLILGIRESASTDRIKEAHRRIMLLNHPDKGGSAYLTAKINEAKDLLMKSK